MASDDNMNTMANWMTLSSAIIKDRQMVSAEAPCTAPRDAAALYPLSAPLPAPRVRQAALRRAGRPFRVAPKTQSRSIALPLERATLGERVAFGLLTVSASVALGQALGLMVQLAPNWDSFNAWVAGLLL